MASPEVQFWGMVIPAGKTAKISLENEDGLMEMFHLTNVALADPSKSSVPCFVKVKSPNDDQAFVVGTLMPGKVFQFQTDLLLQPDTEFTHTGTGDVHLTGYKSISIDEDEDEEDESESMSGSEGDDHDNDFLAPEAASDDEDEDDEDDDSDDLAAELSKRKRNKAAEKLSATRRRARAAPEADDDEEKGSKVTKKAKLNKQSLRAMLEADDDDEGSDSMDVDNEEDGDDEEEEDDEEDDQQDVSAAIKTAQAAAVKVKVEKAAQKAGLSGDDDGAKFDFEQHEFSEDEDSEDEDNGMVKRVKDESEGDDEQDEDDKESPLPAAVLTPATRRSTGQAADAAANNNKRQATTPATAQPAKKSKVSDQPRSAPAKSAGVSKGDDGHPNTPSLNDVTKQYASQVRAFLKTENNEMKMSVLGTKLKRPPGAGKIGDLLKHYPHWFQRSGAKGQETVKLTKEGRS